MPILQSLKSKADAFFSEPQTTETPLGSLLDAGSSVATPPNMGDSSYNVASTEHLHAWEIVSKTYAAPIKADFNTATASESFLERALFGLTNLLYKCNFCAEFRKEFLLGSDISTLDEFIDKADQFGPQYIPVGDKNFVVMKVPPVSQTPGVVPIR